MIAGAHRYARSLGFVSGLGDANPNAFEAVTGLNAGGHLKTAGGTGIFVDAAPTTLIAMFLGTAIGVTMKKSVTGAITGALLGALAATGLRAAGHAGI